MKYYDRYAEGKDWVATDSELRIRRYRKNLPGVATLLKRVRETGLPIKPDLDMLRTGGTVVDGRHWPAIIIPIQWLSDPEKSVFKSVKEKI